MKKVRKLVSSRYAYLLIVAILFGSIGAYLLTSLKAATSTASFEAENATTTGSTAVVNDSSASAARALAFGVPGPAEPSGMPTAATVGVRQAPTRTMTAAEALTELRSTGHLSRATVQGMFSLSGADGIGWTIEDVRFETNSIYGIRGYKSGTAFTGTQAQRPVFRYVDVIGSAARSAGDCSAIVYGEDMIFEHANFYGCIDGIKADDNLEVYDSWVHDLDHPDAAHCDAVQIVTGQNIVFKGNRFDAYIGYSSDGSQTPAGDTGNGVLQTGQVSGDISAVWENNWFAGGHYTIRGPGDRDADFNVDYVFRNNRWLRTGTSVALGLTNLPPNRYGPTYGNLPTGSAWQNNVWDDTDEPVR